MDFFGDVQKFPMSREALEWFINFIASPLHHTAPHALPKVIYSRLLSSIYHSGDGVRTIGVPTRAREELETRWVSIWLCGGVGKSHSMEGTMGLHNGSQQPSPLDEAQGDWQYCKTSSPSAHVTLVAPIHLKVWRCLGQASSVPIVSTLKYFPLYTLHIRFHEPIRVWAITPVDSTSLHGTSIHEHNEAGRRGIWAEEGEMGNLSKQ